MAVGEAAVVGEARAEGKGEPRALQDGFCTLPNLEFFGGIFEKKGFCSSGR